MIYWYMRAKKKLIRDGLNHFLYRMIIENPKRLFTRQIVYRCFLPDIQTKLPKKFNIVKIDNYETINPVFLEKLKKERINFKNIAERRFARKANLWLLVDDTKLLGFLWTLIGKTMKPYFFPLLECDVHFFDNEIFTSYRGNGYNYYLITSVLKYYAEKGMHTAYIETGDWNIAEQRSLSKTLFKPFMKAKIVQLINSVVVVYT